jgi:two-component system OmpR family sensor kinase
VPLRVRLLLALVPLFIVGLAAADIGTYAALQSSEFARVDQEIIAAHQSVLRVLTGESSPTAGAGPIGDASPDSGPGLAVAPGTFGELVSASGQVLAQKSFQSYGQSVTSHPVLPSGLKPGTPSAPNFLTVPASSGGGRYRVYVDTAGEAEQGLVLVVAVPMDEVDATLSRLVALELGVSGGVTLLLALATWLIVRRSLRPLQRMGTTARSIVASGLHQRVEPANDKTEVGNLGLALNTMLEQLEGAFAARAASEGRLRRFVSDASHELRTPLTSMRGYAELLRRNPEMEREEMSTAARRIEDEAKRLGVLVDDLLLLARLDQGRALEHNRVDLEALVTDACADAGVADPGRQVRARIAAPLALVGDDMRLRQVLSNLLRNAIVHTPRGTPIEVVLRPENGSAVLEVVDHGPGIPPEEASRIFERFHRAGNGRSRDRGGSGLGLSIVAAVVAAHGGSVAVVGTPGGGATFRILLPTGDLEPTTNSEVATG